MPLGKRHSAKTLTAKLTLPSVGFRALGKGFAECLDTRQSSHMAPPWASALPSFAECPRLALGKVPAPGSRHVAALPSAGPWHSANFQIFAECQYFSTRQTGCAANLCRPLCRVFWLKHSAKWPIFLFLFLFSLFFDTNTTKIYINAGGHYRQLL